MRYQKFSDRQFFSIIWNFSHHFFTSYIVTIRETKWNLFKWKGFTLMKDPMTLTIYQQLLQDLRPQTILEFGTYEGGSALWMKDIMKSIGADCDVHTFDINAERVKLPEAPDLFFHQMDNHFVAEYVADNRTLFESLQHPILVIEDSHENVFKLLTVMDEFLQSGDYLVVEDTLHADKHEMLKKFVDGKEYLVDTLSDVSAFGTN